MGAERAEYHAQGEERPCLTFRSLGRFPPLFARFAGVRQGIGTCRCGRQFTDYAVGNRLAARRVETIQADGGHHSRGGREARAERSVVAAPRASVYTERLRTAKLHVWSSVTLAPACAG